MAVAGIAGGTAQHDTLRTKRTVTRRIGWPENRDHWNSQGRREMHGAGVAANEQACAARECNQLGERSGKCFGRAAAGGFDGARKVFLSWAEVNQSFQATSCQLPGDFSVALGRPLLGSPTRARVEQREVLRCLALSDAGRIPAGPHRRWETQPSMFPASA